jgi:hypothetical protein
MAKRKSLIDQRLLGTWKSDRRKTFQNFRPRAKASAEAVRKLKALFGKLVVRWTRKKYYTELNGSNDSYPYELVAVDRVSVVIRCFDSLENADKLVQVHFEGNHYWLWAWGQREYFRRIA